MALCLPGVPRKVSPTARARGLPVGVAWCGSSCWLADAIPGPVPWGLTGIRVTCGVRLTSDTLPNLVRRPAVGVIAIVCDTCTRNPVSYTHLRAHETRH